MKKYILALLLNPTFLAADDVYAGLNAGQRPPQETRVASAAAGFSVPRVLKERQPGGAGREASQESLPWTSP
jgi:hypothetical protein